MPPRSSSLPVGTAQQPNNTHSIAYIGSADIFTIFMLRFASAPTMRARDNGHHLYQKDYYSRWTGPRTDASCCSGRGTKNGNLAGDCYPTAWGVHDGHWRANTKDGQRVIVPHDHILRECDPDAKRGYVCFSNAVCRVSLSHRMEANRRAKKSCRRRADPFRALNRRECTMVVHSGVQARNASAATGPSSQTPQRERPIRREASRAFDRSCCSLAENRTIIATRYRWSISHQNQA